MTTAHLPALTLTLTLLSLAGCGGDLAGRAAGEESPPSASEDAASAPAGGPFEKAFAAVSSNALQPLRRAQRSAAPESVARAYFTNQADQVEADRAGGDDATAGDLTRVSGGYRICYPDNDGNPCYVYGNLEVRQGALAAFTVNGRSLRGRLSVGDGSTVQTPLADVELKSAYLASDGSLVTVLLVRSRRAIQIDGGTSYRPPGGTVQQLTSSSGLDELPANSSGWVSFMFRGPLRFGGNVDLKMFTGDDTDATAVVRIG